MFKIEEHIVKIDDEKIKAIVEPACTFFESTALYQLTELPNFKGAGVYAIYLVNSEGTIYDGYLPSEHPIYIGKAVPTGSRQGKNKVTKKQLQSRLKKHLNSITQAENIDGAAFYCRFMVMNDSATEMISTMESYLIRKYSPLWNSYIDGFGINAPGKGRYNQQPSEWDTLHPGRSYVKMLTGEPRDESIIMQKIVNYTATIN